MPSHVPPLPPLPDLATTLLSLVTDYAFLMRVEPDGQFVPEWNNGRLEHATGHSVADRDAQGDWEALIHPDDREEVARSYARAATGGSCSTELRLVWSAEDTRLVRLSLEQIRDTAGVVTHICGTVHDLTEKLAADATILARERTLRQVLDVLPAGVWMVNHDLKLRHMNEAGRRMLPQGFLGTVDAEQYSRLDVRDAGSGDPITFDTGAIGRALTAGEASVDREVEMTTADCGRKLLLSTVLPVRDSTGVVTGAICISTDITERRRLELQLQQAQRMDSIGRMAGGIAHDFNNLLTVIIGCADLALKHDDGVSSSAEWEETLAAARRAAELTSQLLAFARQQPVAPRLVDLSTAVARIRGLVRRVIGQNIVMEVVSSDDQLTVNTDPGQLEQILLNLAVNARDAMADGGGTLRMETRLHTVSPEEAALHPGQTSGIKVRLSVSDTGVGIPGEIRARIFEPFFTTKGPGGGTGLGLAMCYGIVKQAGGFIGVESRLGKGSTFWIDLPLAHGEVQRAPAEVPDRQPGAGARILLVEDEVAVAELARRVLEMDGHSVTVAHNGAEALELFRTLDERPDLLVSDVVMPGMRGTTLAKQLLELDPSLRVVFVSGYPGPLDVEFASAKLLVKPFRPTELLQYVADALRA